MDIWTYPDTLHSVGKPDGCKSSDKPFKESYTVFKHLNDTNEQLEADLVEVGEHFELPPLSLAALPLQQPGGARPHSARVHRQPQT